jgi:hypothetical protein
MDRLLWTRELGRERSGSAGSEKARWPFCASVRPERGYGLFFVVAAFRDLLGLLEVAEVCCAVEVLESVCPVLRLAKRFIQFAKGRRRP